MHQAGFGELAADVDGFLDRGQSLLPPSQVAQPVAEITRISGALAIVCGAISQPLEYERRQARRGRTRDRGSPQRPAQASPGRRLAGDDLAQQLTYHGLVSTATESAGTARRSRSAAQGSAKQAYRAILV